MSVVVHHGDSREVLTGFDDASIDSVVCDPPYALLSIHKRFANSQRTEATEGSAAGPYMRTGRGFMGQRWDTGETAFDPAFWAQVLRVLKPGGHLIAFGGTRTYHRLACAIEDAGFEMRDMIAWLYGSGFPKSHDVSKGIDKSMGLERPVLSEGKAVKRMIPGADQHKDGWEKTDGREFTPTVTAAASAASAAWEGWGTALKPALEPIVLARKPLIGTVAANVLAHGTGALNIDGCRVDGESTKRLRAGGRNDFPHEDDDWTPRVVEVGSDQGRWPANVIHDGSDEVLAAFPETQSGTGAIKRESSAGSRGNALGKESRPAGTPMICHGDSGSAARFFYSAKADAADRLGSKHPTVKPVDLMAYLCRLITPPGGVVLDPFAGSGTTGMACLREGFDCILIEREEQYVADIKRRIAHVSGEDAPLFAGSAA